MRVAFGVVEVGRGLVAAWVVAAVITGFAGCRSAPHAEPATPSRAPEVSDSAPGTTASAPAADVVATAPVASPIGLENLNAVLWVQTAVEYRATSRQAYALATRVLDEALVDRSWTAALEQRGSFGGLPPAVILDIDETVLDNSFFEARLTLDGDVYSSELWDDWVLEENATGIPGALAFCIDAAERGVTVFYVSNRRAHLEEATRNNLTALGFPLSGSEDTVLLRGEIPEWDMSDKTPRRGKVASTHRILMLLGDNMGDFTAASEGSVAERLAFADAHLEYWGGRWITFANPTYGSFLNAIIDNDFSLSFEQQIEMKRRALDPRRR